MNGYFAPAASVRVEGLTLAADVSDAIINVTYDNKSEAADMFSLTLDDSAGRFRESSLFDVGKSVEIHMGYKGNMRPMMLGEITSIAPLFSSSSPPTLKVSGYDRSYKLRHNQPERFTFKYVNDSAIAAIIAAENGLIPIVDPAPTGVHESVQQTGSDWALLSEMAEKNFFELFVDWDRLYFRFPRPQLQKTILEYGENLIEFEPRLSIAGQVGIQILRDYDYRLANEIVSILPVLSIGGDVEAILEKVGSALKDQLMSLGRYVIRKQKVDNYVDAAVVAKSLLSQLLSGLFEGRGSCIGAPSLIAGDQVEIRGVGDRFGGTYTLSRVQHSIGENGYITQFEITQRFRSSILKALRRNIRDMPSPDRQDPQSDFIIATVLDNVDTDGMGRVRLRFPTLSGMNMSAWARVCVPYAGIDLTTTESYGAYFLPEIGDEVVVSFIDGDVNKPVVVGSVWNGVARPPETNITGTNDRKVIRSRSGMTILLNDAPARESLELTDNRGSTIKLDAFTGDIEIRARRNIVIKSGVGGRIDLNPPVP